MAIHKIDANEPNDPNERKVTVTLKCPTCGKPTPHSTNGVKKNAALGGTPTQAMQCAVCKTVTDVATGEGGRDFQSNVDEPDGA